MACSLPIDVAKEASLQDREIRQRGSCSQLSYRAPAARRPATQVGMVWYGAPPTPRQRQRLC
jgi:hypothetical protein